MGAKSPNIEPVAVPSSGRPDEIKPRARKLRGLVPVLILMLAAALFVAISTNWNAWVGRRAARRPMMPTCEPTSPLSAPGFRVP